MAPLLMMTDTTPIPMVKRRPTPTKATPNLQVPSSSPSASTICKKKHHCWWKLRQFEGKIIAATLQCSIPPLQRASLQSCLIVIYQRRGRRIFSHISTNGLTSNQILYQILTCGHLVIINIEKSSVDWICFLLFYGCRRKTHPTPHRHWIAGNISYFMTIMISILQYGGNCQPLKNIPTSGGDWYQFQERIFWNCRPGWQGRGCRRQVDKMK